MPRHFDTDRFQARMCSSDDREQLILSLNSERNEELVVELARPLTSFSAPASLPVDRVSFHFPGKAPVFSAVSKTADCQLLTLQDGVAVLMLRLHFDHPTVDTEGWGAVHIVGQTRVVLAFAADEVLEEIQSALRGRCGFLPPAEARLRHDLHLDSVQLLELVSQIEDRFGVHLSYEDGASVETISDLARLVISRRAP